MTLCTRKFLDEDEVSKIDAMNGAELADYIKSMHDRWRKAKRERASDFVLCFYEHRVVYAQHRQNEAKDK